MGSACPDDVYALFVNMDNTWTERFGILRLPGFEVYY